MILGIFYVGQMRGTLICDNSLSLSPLCTPYHEVCKELYCFMTAPGEILRHN